MSDTLTRKVALVKKQLRRIGIRFRRNEPKVVPSIDFSRPLAENSISSCFCCQDRPVIMLRPFASTHVVRHEFGHYVVWAFKLARLKLYKGFNKQCNNYDTRVFGFFLLQGVANALNLRPAGFPSYYGRVDGEELFCECFARLLDHGWDAERACDNDKALLKKLVTVQQLVEKISRK